VRLEPQHTERIDRSVEISFRVDGVRMTGFAGDTIGSALAAAGSSAAPATARTA